MSKITSKIVKVTPDIARNYLTNNDGNRNIIEAKVMSFTAQMTTGDWKLNGENIIIGKSGRMLNGQHRMLAVIESGKTIPMSFIFGIDESTFDTIDTGTARTAATALNMYGLTPHFASMVASQIRTDMTIKHLGSLMQSRNVQSHITPSAILTEFENDEDYRLAAEFVNGYPIKIRPIAGGQLAFLAYRFFKIDKAFSEEWLDGLITGSNLDASDYRLWIRNRLWRNTNSVRKLKVNDKNFLIIKAWNWARNNNYIKHESSLTVDRNILKYISLPTDLK